jgi:hypothetical protein
MLQSRVVEKQLPDAHAGLKGVDYARNICPGHEYITVTEPLKDHNTDELKSVYVLCPKKKACGRPRAW